MATVGPKLTIPFIVGAGQIVGQGSLPELWCVYTTDDASVVSPAWVDASTKVRAGETSRGRQNELNAFDTGTASVTLDNRARTFDPTLHPEFAPMNRWWLRAQFSGETRDLFKGYAERYDQDWPDAGFDATCVVSLADEFKVLALDNLPTTSPPRNSYLELVASDAPDGLWPLNEPVEKLVQDPVDVPAPGDEPGGGLTWGQRRGSFGWRP